MRRPLIHSSTPAVAAFYTIVFAAIVTGALGLTYYTFFPVTQPLLEVISTTAAVVSLAVGFAMLGAIRDMHLVRVVFSALVTLSSTYSVIKGVYFPDSALIPFSLVSASVYWPISSLFIVMGVCLLFGISPNKRRVLWRTCGVLCTLAGLVYLGMCWFGDNYQLFGKHPIVVTISALYLSMFGVALFIGSYLRDVSSLKPSVRAIWVGALSVITVCSFWFALTVSEVQRTAQQADRYLVQTVALRELVTHQNVQLMQRLARRWQNIGLDELPLLMEVDVLSYLNDVPHLSSILFLDADGQLDWEERKPEQIAFAPLLDTPDVQRWLVTSARQPSFHAPIQSYQAPYSTVIMVKLPVFRPEHNDEGARRTQLFGTVIAVFDFAKLVNPTGSNAVTLLHTHVRVNDYYLLRSTGETTEVIDTRERTPQALYAVARNMRMPFGINMPLEGYLIDLQPLVNLANLYVLVLMGGLLLAVFLVISSETGQILRAQRRRLKIQATHDSLTGLVNRTVIEDQLQHWCQASEQSGETIGVLFIDLDGFKPVNDSMGLAIGDRLLQETATRIQRAVNQHCVVGRFGGDEFIVLVPKLSVETPLTDVVAELLSTIAQPYHIEQYRLYITASIGVTTSIQSPLDAKQMIQHADMAMYQAKRLGRNHYHMYSSEISQHFYESVTLRNQLQHVLEKGALKLYYQPIIRSQDAKVVGVEALLRWQRDDGSFVPPSAFIPLAEDTGQIIPISSWVLHQACVDGLKMQEFGDIEMAINLSARQFSRSNFIESLTHTLNLTGFSARLLHLELTESVLMDDTRRAIEQLSKLRARHFRVSLDDFGTGFSSLAYLKTLPVDCLKIDRSFIKDVTEDENDAAITRSIIDMAKQLKLSIIAEGVETKAQAQFIREAGVEFMQGFYLARPMPLDQLLNFLAEQNGEV
ncbi:MAG: EAL domain-containing protein [Aliidiomarina sp.]|uniref:EAL domain-containing protein n=1 Tax=Aliidiomarina sp. TaxID=1872439 RepID=UPI0025BAFA92|nr:EAL domain-containing protein [Aliidiomarina sp.]MCH8501680.1 EAL domain-containing protein [Aliidiomarina sp.]